MNTQMQIRKSMKQKSRIGIIGYGKMGRIRADIICKRDDCKLVAVFDSDPSSSITKGNAVHVSQIEDLWNLGLDCVFICAYTSAVASYTKEALRRGLHVFCEKPPALNLAQMREVEKVYLAGDSVLKYGFNHRYHHSVMKAKEILDGGTLGRMLFIRSVYGKAGSIDFDKNWRNYKEFSGGGILIDQGIHMIDLISLFVGKPPRVHSKIVATRLWDIESEDNAMILFEGPQKEPISLHSSATQWRHKFQLEIYCEHGYITLDGILSQTLSYAPERLTLGLREHEDIFTGMGKPRETVYEFGQDDSWKMEIDEFLNAAVHGSPVRHGSVNDAIAVMEILKEVYEG